MNSENVIAASVPPGYSIVPTPTPWPRVSSKGHKSLLDLKNALAAQGNAIGAEWIVNFTSDPNGYQGSGQPVRVQPITQPKPTDGTGVAPRPEGLPVDGPTGPKTPTEVEIDPNEIDNTSSSSPDTSLLNEKNTTVEENSENQSIIDSLPTDKTDLTRNSIPESSDTSTILDDPLRSRNPLNNDYDNTTHD